MLKQLKPQRLVVQQLLSELLIRFLCFIWDLVDVLKLILAGSNEQLCL